MYLIHHDEGGIKHRVDIGLNPRTGIQAAGIFGDCRSHYYLETMMDDGKGTMDKPESKPPYRVPPMAEIAAAPKNGFTVVSTFSGCGGSCLGFEMAGYSVLWASEFNHNAAETYRLNHPGVVLDVRDIRAVEPEEILAAVGRKAGEIDVLEGSPPCQSFSTAGKREKTWGQVRVRSDGTTQRDDDLFFEFARLLRGLMPRVFVAENVSGLVKGVSKGYFKLILAELKSCGYDVEARLLDAQWLGVPQARQRIIFVGVRGDLGMRPVFPKPLPYRYSVAEAIPWLLAVRNGPDWEPAQTVPDGTVCAMDGARKNDTALFGTYMVEAVADDSYGKPHGMDNTPSPTGRSARAGTLWLVRKGHGYFPGDAKDMAECPAPTVNTTMAGCGESSPHPELLRGAVAEEWDRLGEGESSERYFNLRRANRGKPCPTVTAIGGTGCASVAHPVERRKFTIAELRRICSFPDDFQLVGSYAEQWARLGNAVPPLMMEKVAQAVKTEVLDRIGAGGGNG